MTYETLRQLADSWGLVATMVLFLTLVAWPFLPHARDSYTRAATMILEDEEQPNG